MAIIVAADQQMGYICWMMIDLGRDEEPIQVSGLEASIACYVIRLQASFERD